MAIKFLFDFKDLDFYGRVDREVKIVARLRSPHAVTLHDSGVHDGNHYLVLEHLEGCTLEEQVRREGALAPKRVAKILRQILLALDEAHELGVIHRDIKPENIFNVGAALGLGDYVKVLDFGIAKIFSPDSELHHSLQPLASDPGDVKGTLAYLAPEAWDAEPVPHPRQDLYSLGMVGWYLLEGARAGHELSVTQLLSRQLSMADPLQLPPGDAQELRDIINRLIARHPQDRYPDCAAALEALSQLEAREARAALPVVAPPARPDRDWVRWALAALLLGSLAMSFFRQPEPELATLASLSTAPSPATPALTQGAPKSFSEGGR